MTWHLAPSLVQLRTEVNRLWPQRSRVSDGTIGNAAHAARKSDHNPNARRSVNAIDITAKGIHVSRLIRAAIAHPATAYVIHGGYIWSRTYGWKRRTYTGSNPHHTHVHISIQQTAAAEASTMAWLASPAQLPVRTIAGVKFGARSAAVRLYQQRLRDFLDAPNRLGPQGVEAFNPHGATGHYGTETVALTNAMHQVLANETGDKGWLRLDGRKPGKSLLARLRLRT